jgi:hypothetical protein
MALLATAHPSLSDAAVADKGRTHLTDWITRAQTEGKNNPIKAALARQLGYAGETPSKQLLAVGTNSAGMTRNLAVVRKDGKIELVALLSKIEEVSGVKHGVGYLFRMDATGALISAVKSSGPAGAMKLETLDASAQETTDLFQAEASYYARTPVKRPKKK